MDPVGMYSPVGAFMCQGVGGRVRRVEDGGSNVLVIVHVDSPDPGSRRVPGVLLRASPGSRTCLTASAGTRSRTWTCAQHLTALPEMLLEALAVASKCQAQFVLICGVCAAPFVPASPMLQVFR